MKTHVQTLPDGSVLPSLPKKQDSSGPVSFLPEINLKVPSLPSRALAYPKNAVVKYRPYTFGEIKKISQSKFSPKERFEFVLSGIDCSFDKYDLTVSDLLFLSFLRRISTFGTEKLLVGIRCPECNKDYQEELEVGSHVSKIEFIDLKAPSLPVVVELSSGKEYEFLPLTIKKIFEIIDSEQDYSDDLVLLSFMSKHPQKEMLEIISNLTQVEDREALELVDQYLMHGLKPVTIKCKNKTETGLCGHESTVELDGGEALLLPFREHKKPLRNRIRFGTQASHRPH